MIFGFILQPRRALCVFLFRTALINYYNALCVSRDRAGVARPRFSLVLASLRFR